MQNKSRGTRSEELLPPAAKQTGEKGLEKPRGETDRRGGGSRRKIRQQSLVAGYSPNIREIKPLQYDTTLRRLVGRVGGDLGTALRSKIRSNRTRS